MNYPVVKKAKFIFKNEMRIRTGLKELAVGNCGVLVREIMVIISQVLQSVLSR
jgi:hypothetical protein